MFFSSSCPGSVTTNLKPPFPRPKIVESTEDKTKTSIAPRDNNDNDDEDSKKKKKNKKRENKKSKTSESEPSPPSRLVWRKLPAEIRRMILDDLINDPSNKPALSSWASVCADWQVLIEEHTFKSLHLKWDDSRTDSELPTFEAIVTGHRRRLLKNVTLEIMLGKYSCLTIKKLMKHLTGLERVVYEPMQAVGKDVKQRQKANTALLRKLPSSIESLSLYEARSEYLEMQQMGVSTPPEVRTGKKVVAAAVAASLRCRNLQELSLSNAVDAEDFFTRALEDPAVKDTSGDAPWPNLRRVALSTRYERRGDSKVSPYQLLRDAASVALRMPKLETMEIWAESELRRFLFRYHVEGDQAVIRVEIDSEYYEEGLSLPHLPCAKLVKAVEKTLKMWRKVAGPRRQLSHIVERVDGQAAYWDDSDDEDAIYDDEDQKTWPPAPSVCESLRLNGLVRDASAKRRFVFKDWY
ncbi:hypothetical protein COL154_006046 [Colletotrichum chrysophilum]|uniref:uncharacterized protein n=1 Tax=Colletotrichum chrysophilum TaxID=1836956 RepID=UPI00230165D0|nr:uncharacterized protein COL26b_009797 [Colletotrichum chrysophilum]KAJ0362601.1 hypothetical protein COL154_006046 [Colletotrichum chrysophilum]KAJ0371001.1 hypothetical protein COL26b_009797 [Colletotrichum chrysophilum]